MGVCRQKNISPCVNPVNVQYYLQWLPGGATYEARRKSLSDSLRQSLGQGKYWLQTFAVTAGAEYSIVVVQKSRRCADGANTRVITTYSFYGGKTPAQINTQLEADKHEYPENISQQIVQLLDCRAALAGAEPPVRPRPPAGAWLRATSAG